MEASEDESDRAWRESTRVQSEACTRSEGLTLGSTGYRFVAFRSVEGYDIASRDLDGYYHLGKLGSIQYYSHVLRLTKRISDNRSSRFHS